MRSRRGECNPSDPRRDRLEITNADFIPITKRGHCGPQTEKPGQSATDRGGRVLGQPLRSVSSCSLPLRLTVRERPLFIRPGKCPGVPGNQKLVGLRSRSERPRGQKNVRNRDHSELRGSRNSIGEPGRPLWPSSREDRPLPRHVRASYAAHHSALGCLRRLPRRDHRVPLPFLRLALSGVIFRPAACRQGSSA